MINLIEKKFKDQFDLTSKIQKYTLCNKYFVGTKIINNKYILQI